MKKQSPVLRYYLDYRGTEMSVARIEMANQYLEAMNQPLYAHSEWFWAWWDNLWRNIDHQVEKELIEMGDVPVDRARDLWRARHAFGPQERYPHPVLADRISREVTQHFELVTA